MKTIITALLGLCTVGVLAQTKSSQTVNQPSASGAQPWGKVDMADLEMKKCDFEPDANAEILFDKANVYPDGDITVIERHTRIKILNDFGKKAANIRVEYVSYLDASDITDIKGETFNLENGKIVIAALEKKQIVTERTDKIVSAMVFAMPNVKPGSVFEYKYRYAINGGNIPDWYFQSEYPTRYSEIKIDAPVSDNSKQIRISPHVTQPYALSVGGPGDLKVIKALANVHSLPDEPFMGPRADNLQRLEYLNLSTKFNTWDKVAGILMSSSDFGDQLGRGLKGEDVILKHANTLKTPDEKIAYIFGAVKKQMAWNNVTHFYTQDGTSSAWNKGTGNSAEINIILYHLLKKAGIKPYIMVVSPRKDGRIMAYNPNVYKLNNTIVYIHQDSVTNYVLDASNKFNLYNTPPADQLNRVGLIMDEDKEQYGTRGVFTKDAALQSMFINAEVKPDGKITGSAEISSSSYYKTLTQNKYQQLSEEKFLKSLKNNDNAIMINGFKMSDGDDDTLPLVQKFDFIADHNTTDDKFIYVNTTLFNLLVPNPFTNEERYSEIDFMFNDTYAFNTIYKLPAGYKIDALPKNIALVSPDHTIGFQRSIIDQNGSLNVRCVLRRGKFVYTAQDYPDIRGFYKQLYDLLNEQIVLKKI